jgi:hypothetical protein
MEATETLEKVFSDIKHEGVSNFYNCLDTREKFKFQRFELYNGGWENLASVKIDRDAGIGTVAIRCATVEAANIVIRTA